MKNGNISGRGGRESSNQSKKNLWESFLKEVSSRSGTPQSFIIAIENSIITYQSAGSKYSLLDYFFLEAKDSSDIQSDDIYSRIHIWYIDSWQDVDFLKEILKPEHLTSCMFLIVLDYSAPWRLIEDLQNWLLFIHQITEQLFPKLPLAQQDELKQELSNYIRLYQDPVTDQKTGLVISSKSGVLTANLGVPIMVLCNKSQFFKSPTPLGESLNKNFQIIQYHLRSKCLTYGASIMNVSSKQMINIDVLYQYVMHRLYDMDFKYQHQIYEQQKYFIPAGWDSQTLISQLNHKSKDQPFEALFKKPPLSKEEKKNGDQHTQQLIYEQTWNLEDFLKDRKLTQTGGHKKNLEGFFKNLLKNN